MWRKGCKKLLARLVVVEKSKSKMREKEEEPLPRSATLTVLLSAPPPALALPTDPGLLPSPLILLIPKASLSNIGLDPNNEGDGSGCELCMDIDLDRGVWLPPLPFEGGTPSSLVVGDAGFEADIASLDWISGRSLV
jgi:hypothetical protein